MLLKIKKGLN